MIEFRTLGLLDLRASNGAEVRAVLQQPKRLGLLAYLSVSAPRRFHRRDTLLALFWPELDQEHARAALRRSLYFLRSELGPAAIVGRGDEEIAVPQEVLWCDTTALDRALAAGEMTVVLQLYRGTLLEGLYVSGTASEFQEWLDSERARLRRAVAAAAQSVSEDLELKGRLDEAAQMCRRALELLPDHEATLRRLLGLLDRSGDRSAALRIYDEYARRLLQEFDLEPGAETRLLVESIRQRRDAVGQLDSQATPGSSATPMAERIAVLPFSVRGNSRYAYLGEGMVDLLATQLDGAGEIRAVDPRALLRFVHQDVRAGKDLDAPAIAQHFRAGRYLVGSIVEAGGRIRASSSLYSLDGRLLAGAEAEAPTEDQLFELVDDLARQLVSAHGVNRGSRLTRIAALTTTSLPALRAFLTGECELRDGRYFGALHHFQSAVDADPSFALAHYRLAAAAAGCALADLARAHSDKGFADRQRLSPHDQLVFSAQRAWLQGSVRDAESLYNTITGTYPDDVEAWFHLGDLLFHSNPLRGRSAAESRKPLERVLRLEPRHVAAMVHLVRVCALERRTAEMLQLIERILETSPDGDQALAMRALRAFATHSDIEIAKISEELQHARALTVAIAFSDVALYSGDLGGAENLARGFLQAARSPELRSLCHTLIAHLALTAGKPDIAWQELQHARSLDPTWGLEMQGLFAALPFANVADSQRRDVYNALSRWDPATAPSSMFLVFAMHNGLHPALRAYLLGLLSLRSGDVPSATSHSLSLAELEDSQAGLVPSLGVELRAAIARAEGRTADALTMLERPQPQHWFQLTVASPFFSQTSQRYLRAELLREVGRTREASAWYSSIAQRSPYELIYAEPARQRLEEMGLSR